MSGSRVLVSGSRVLTCAGVALVAWSSAAGAQHCPQRLAGARGDGTEAAVAEMNGTHLAHEVRGSGPPVVLIHGGLVDSRLWDDQVEALSERHRVIRYDLRGFGRSDFPQGPFSHVEDLGRCSITSGCSEWHWWVSRWAG